MQTEAAKSANRPQVVPTVRSIITEGGVQALWRGSSATVVRLGLGAGLHFLFIDIAKSALQRPMPDGRMGLSPGAAALAGGCARALSAAALCPVTLVKTRLEYGRGEQMYRGPVMAVRQIYTAEGARGLFRGLGPTILTNAPFSGLYYMFYTQLQGSLSAEGRNQTAVNFGSGTIAAAAATIITQPADIVRTRSQMGLMQQRMGMIKALQHIASSQGPAALMTGTTPKIVKKVLQTALVWTLYEELVPRLSTAVQLAKAKAAAGPTAPGPG